MSEHEKDQLIASLKSEISILKTILHRIPGNIYWKTKDDVVLGCNINAAEAINLKSPEDAIGKRGVELYGEELAEKIIEIDRQVMAANTEITFEEFGMMQGKPAIYLSRKSPFYDEQGELIGVIGISVDITDRKRMEEALKVSQKKAEEASLAKSRFLAMISHEFRIPLTSIIGFANFLEQEELGLEDKATYLEHIVHSSQYLLSLVNKLLDFSKLEAEKMELVPGPVNLKKFVTDVIVMLEGISKDKNLPLYLDYDSKLPEVIVTDARILKQVLINLIGNAIKFTQTGHVIIKVICLEANRKSATVEISVTDTGIGIPSDKLDDVFKEFYQVDDVYTRSTSMMGTGLGLAIVKRLVKLLGGDIKVSSQVNEGSTFTLTNSFPIFQKQTEGISNLTMSSNTTNNLLQDMKILLVEDDAVVQFVHHKMLMNLGCSVDLAENGQKALSMFKNNYSVIFVDIGLPDMNGFELIEEMRKVELGNHPTSIIALTGFFTKEEKERCLHAGADEVIVKPVSQILLKELLIKHTRQHQD